jgi:ribonuclease VapC
MIADSSALLAILFEEPEESRMTMAILASTSRSISAATLLEAAMVFEGQVGPRGAVELDALVGSLGLQVLPFTATQAVIARQAFRSYGKGKHPARLNFGDCMAYALAKERGEPLMFKGADFPQTDVGIATY